MPQQGPELIDNAKAMLTDDVMVSIRGAAVLFSFPHVLCTGWQQY
jgi:hypothetical protein